MADAEVTPPVTVALRGRTVSDAMSGMSITRSAHEAYSTFTQEELESQFAKFKNLDVDNSGFITPANLKSILEALDMPDVTEAQCVNMIEEVAILVGHDNDGKLSFRDYCSLIAYEKKKKQQDELVQAHEELRNSMREEEEEEEEKVPGATPAPPPPPPDASVVALEEEIATSLRVEEEEGDTVGAEAPASPAPALAPTRMRGSSFAVMDAIAFSRINRFEQVIQDVAAKEAKDPKEMYRARAFENKLSKFKAIENGTPTVVNAEDMHKKTLKAKLAAFEQAAKKKEPVAFKTSWKNVHAGKWQQKKTIAGGVAPKKDIKDWL